MLITQVYYYNWKKLLLVYDVFIPDLQQIKPLLEQIDIIHTQVTKLEANAYRLDSYTKQLKVRFKELEDKWGNLHCRTIICFMNRTQTKCEVLDMLLLGL